MSDQTKCLNCGTEVDSESSIIFGILIKHFFFPASHSTCSKHSMAATTVAHACMTKVNRCNSEHAIVYSFIPTDQLPSDSPHKMDAFLQPLLEELEDLYIEGMEVIFCSGVDGISPPNDITTLRVLPLLVTADFKAHAEVGLTAAGGRKGCRRCHVIGEYVHESKHYYYGETQLRYRLDNRALGKHADQASSKAHSKRLIREKGVTGETIIHRFYDLCQFDPVYDLVIDVMHAIALNLVKSELKTHPLGRGILCKDKPAKALKCVQWTHELKDGRVASVSLSSSQDNRYLGHWKSEDYSKFVLVAPCVLHSLIPQDNYLCFMLLCRIHQLVYNKTMRVQGWEKKDMVLLKHLLWSHAIA